MYNRISDLRTDPQEYQKPFNSRTKKINNEELENLLLEYFRRDRGIEISKKEIRNKFEKSTHVILADSLPNFLDGDYLMGILIEAGSAEFAYSLIVREGKRMVGFVTTYGFVDDGVYFSEKDNMIIENFNEFLEPDRINAHLSEETYRERLLTTQKNVQIGSPRFFK